MQMVSIGIVSLSYTCLSWYRDSGCACYRIWGHLEPVEKLRGYFIFAICDQSSSLSVGRVKLREARPHTQQWSMPGLPLKSENTDLGSESPANPLAKPKRRDHQPSCTVPRDKCGIKR